MTSKLITCFIDGFTSKRKSQSIAYLLNGSAHIYWILDLEDEVHSIWVIWTSGLHSWGRTIGRKDKTNLEGHRSEGQVSGNLARAAWAVTRKISEGRECGGAHQRLSRRTELVGVSLASATRDLQEFMKKIKFTRGGERRWSKIIGSKHGINFFGVVKWEVGCPLAID